MELIEPSIKYWSSVLAADQEFIQNHEERLVESSPDKSAEETIQAFKDHKEGKNLQPGYVPYTELWLVDNGEYVGTVSIRHKLTYKLRCIGGHIGYAVRPSKRRLGYGVKMLALALPIAKKIGIKNALITCDQNNIGSRKIIEKNGGKRIKAGVYKGRMQYWYRIKLD